MDIHDAAEAGDLQVVEEILDCDPERLAASFGSTLLQPLHCAALRGHLPVVDCLLRRGAAVNARDYEDRTPLHFASLGGFAEVVERLLDAGADPMATNRLGWTPLNEAGRGYEGKDAVADLLLTRGVSLDLYSALALNRLSEAWRILEASGPSALAIPHASALLGAAVQVAGSIAGGRFQEGSRNHVVYGEVVSIIEKMVELGVPLIYIYDAIRMALTLCNRSIAEALMEIAARYMPTSEDEKKKLAPGMMRSTMPSAVQSEMVSLLREYGF